MKIITDIDQLHQPTKQVSEADPALEAIVSTLFEELNSRDDCAGLAANQFGFKLKVLVMRLEQYAPICIINPVITKAKSSHLGPETCLSLPGQKVAVKRPQQITVKGVNQYFKFVKYRFHGLLARVACHEIDLLNGILITDET